LKIQCVFVILLSLFVIRNFWRYTLIWLNVEWVHGKRKVENPCPKKSQLTDCRKHLMTIATSACEWTGSMTLYCNNHYSLCFVLQL